MKITRESESTPTAMEWRQKADELVEEMYDLGHAWDWEYSECGQVHIYQNNLDTFINAELDTFQKYLSDRGWTNVTKDKKSVKATDGDDYIVLEVKKRFPNPTNEISSEHFVLNNLRLIVEIEKEIVEFDIEVESAFQMIEGYKICNDKLSWRGGVSVQAEVWKSTYENIVAIKNANQEVIDKKSYNFKLSYKQDMYDSEEEAKYIDNVTDIMKMLEE